MAVAFNTKMMLAACVLIALVAATDEAGVATIDGRRGGGGFTKAPTRAPTKNPTRAPTEQVCCEFDVDKPGKCVSSIFPYCLKCPSGSNVSTWIEKTNTSTTVTFTAQGNTQAKVTSSTSNQNWRLQEAQTAIISADKSCYGSMRDVKMSVKLPGKRDMEPRARVSFAKMSICKKGTGDNPDQCAASKAITLCRTYPSYASSQQCSGGNKMSESECDGWLKYPHTTANGMSGKGGKFMTGDEATKVCLPPSDAKIYTQGTTKGTLWQLCKRQCWLAIKSTTSDKLSSTGCADERACTADEEAFVATAV